MAVAINPKFQTLLTVEEATAQSRLLKALADTTRLRILSLLGAYEGGLCVFGLTRCFPLKQSTISHHLRILLDAGLIVCRKRGVWSYYYVRHESLHEVERIIKMISSQGEKGK